MPQPLSRLLGLAMATTLVSTCGARTSLTGNAFDEASLRQPAWDGTVRDVEPRAEGVPPDRGENKRHPLKGVVVEIYPEKQALLIKHEEVPGVMRAMTMLLKAEASALTACKKGDAITGLLVRKTDGWWVEELTVTRPR